MVGLKPMAGLVFVGVPKRLYFNKDVENYLDKDGKQEKRSIELSGVRKASRFSDVFFQSFSQRGVELFRGPISRLGKPAQWGW